MLTEDINSINNYYRISCKFATIVYNKMMVKRYGVKTCKECGSNDIVGGKNIHILDYEKLRLSQMRDCNFEQSIKC